MNKLLIEGAELIDLSNVVILNKLSTDVSTTTENMQLVKKSLKPNDVVPRERHSQATQFIFVIKGELEVVLDDKRYIVTKGQAITIAPNTWHELVNNSNSDCKLFTIYSPPQHSLNEQE
jgi:quercetin dioxygenase-like cupin family protein